LGRWEWNYSSGEVVCSPLKLQALGYQPGELSQQIYDWTSRIHPQDYDRAMDSMRSHLTGTAEVYEVEYRIRTKTGDYRWFYDRGRISALDAAGKPLTIAGIVFDITKSKSLETQLRESLAFQSRLLTIISHDVRGPLGTMKSLLASLDLYQPDEYPQLLAAVAGSNGQVYDLIGGLLEWARINQNHPVPTLVPVPLLPLLQIQKNLLEPTARTKSIALLLEVEAQLLVLGEPMMLQVVFRNLMANALKFTPEGGTVTLRALPHQNTVEVRVIDTGRGMSAAELNHLSETQGLFTSVGTAGETGTGLGLVLCREFVRLNGGQLTVDSVVGQGSAFTVTLGRGF
jgi:PAS domain S-box-containing protein